MPTWVPVELAIPPHSSTWWPPSLETQEYVISGL